MRDFSTAATADHALMLRMRRSAVFGLLGAAAGSLAVFVPPTPALIWGVGFLLPAGPAAGLWLAHARGWGGLHTSWPRELGAVLLMMSSLAWAALGFEVGIRLAGATAWSMNTVFFTGLVMAAVFTVALVYAASALALRRWAPRIAIELALAAALTLALSRVSQHWIDWLLCPVGMGLFSFILGWQFLGSEHLDTV